MNTSANTNFRLSILSELRAITESSNAILWLIEQRSETGMIELLTSYHVSSDQDCDDLLQGSSLTVYSPIAYNKQGQAKNIILPAIRRLLSEHKLDSEQFYFQFLYPPHLRPYCAENTGTDDSAVGIVGYDGHAQVSLEKTLDLLALAISQTRASRIAKAIQLSQELRENTNDQTETLFLEYAELARELIGAKVALYRDRNSGNEWLSTKDNNKRFIVTHKDIDPMSFQKAKIIKDVTIIYESGLEKKHSNSIIYPLLEPANILTNVEFNNSQIIVDQLEECIIADRSILFTDKSTTKYLQNIFSHTDLQVSSSLLYSTENYSSITKFSKNSQIIDKYLKHIGSKSSLSANSILGVLNQFSQLFTATWIGTIEPGAKNSFTLDSTSTTAKELPEQYIITLENRASSALKSRKNDAELLVAISPVEDIFRFEVLLPSYSNEKQILIIEHSGGKINTSILRSFISLLNELKLIFQNDSHYQDRASYLLQVRHAIIHHISASLTSIKALKETVRSRSRSKAHWDKLYTESSIAESPTRAMGSLSQALLLIENGRFLINKLKSSDLNRKPIHIERIIRSCTYSLEDKKSEKGITPVLKVVGHPSKIMNGDDQLLSIAIMNLVDNAYKYSLSNKVVTITISYYQDHYVVDFNNYGEPINADVAEKLFDVGFRAKQKDNLNTRHGTGLGLPVSRMIIEAHSPKAKLTVISTESDKESKGSSNTFSFTMPYLTGTSD